jgi:hypothetical protein
VLKTRGFEGDSRQAGPVRPVYNADQPITALKGTGIPCLGIDPADGPVAEANTIGVPTIHDFFGSRCAEDLAGKGKLAAAPTVRITTNGKCRSVRSATHPPTSTPPIMPAMYAVKAEEAASIAKPCTWWRIVISQDWIPAPAIDETMKNAKNISTERLSSSRAPEAGACRAAARLPSLIVDDAALPQDRRDDRKAEKAEKADEQQRAAPPQQQGQSRRCRRRGGKPDMPDKGVKSKGASQFRPIHRPAKDRLVRRVNDRIADTRQQRQPDDLPIGGGEAHRRDRQGHQQRPATRNGRAP